MGGKWTFNPSTLERRRLLLALYEQPSFIPLFILLSFVLRLAIGVATRFTTNDEDDLATRAEAYFYYYPLFDFYILRFLDNDIFDRRYFGRQDFSRLGRVGLLDALNLLLTFFIYHDLLFI